MFITLTEAIRINMQVKLSLNKFLGGSWCGGIHNWRDIWRLGKNYSASLYLINKIMIISKLHLDPLSQVDSGSKHRLLGGEL